MMSPLLQLSLGFVLVVELTSSQLTYDRDARPIPQENCVSSCDSNREILNQLVTLVLQLQKNISELKVGKRQYDATG